MSRELKKIEKYVKDIENKDFSVSLISEVITIKNMIKDKGIREKIDEILKESFKKIFKDDYQDILLGIIEYTNLRSELCIPLNFILYNGVLFCEEILLDDFDKVDKKRYIVVSNNHYLDIDNIKLMYDLTPPHEEIDYIDYFDNDKEEELFRSLASNINSISRKENLEDVVFPIVDLSKNGSSYGRSGLIYKSDVRVLVNFELKDLKKYIYNQDAVHLGMIVIAGENFYSYDVLQQSNSGNMLNWTVNKKTVHKWNLTEELEKSKTKMLV